MGLHRIIVVVAILLLASAAGITITVKNLFDRTYIVDRSRDILPSSPRLVQAKLSFAFRELGKRYLRENHSRTNDSS